MSTAERVGGAANLRLPTPLLRRDSAHLKVRSLRYLWVDVGLQVRYEGYISALSALNGGTTLGGGGGGLEGAGAFGGMGASELLAAMGVEGAADMGEAEIMALLQQMMGAGGAGGGMGGDPYGEYAGYEGYDAYGGAEAEAEEEVEEADDFE
jgi:hypothetical protein